MLRIARIIVLVLAANLVAGSAAFATVAFTIQNDVHTCSGQSTGSFDVVVSSATAGTSLQLQVILFTSGGPVPIVDTTIPMPALGAFPYTFPVTGLAPGDYAVRVAHLTPNSSLVKPFTITDFTVTLDGSTPNTDVDCDSPDGTISVTTDALATPNGAVTWAWTGPNGFTSTDEDLTGLAGGDYDLTYTDGTTTCTLPTVHIDDPVPSPFSITSTDVGLCDGDALVVDISLSDLNVTYDVVEGLTVLASAMGNGGALTITVPSLTVSGLGAGTHTIGVQASQGCPVIFNLAPDLTVVLDDVPTITAVVSPEVCLGATTGTVTYGATTGNPDFYSIAFSPAALAAGFVDVTDGAFAPPANIVINIPGTATSATYAADLTIRNSVTGCVSAVESIQVLINPAVSIAPDPIPAVCSGTTSVNLTFVVGTGTPDQYDIDFDVTAEGEGFVDVTAGGPVVSPIAINVPALAAAGTYNAVLTISNTTTTCFATYPIAITINPNPTITLGPDPTICELGTSASLTYTATTAEDYTLDFGAAADAAGFADIIAFTPLAVAPSQISIVVPGTATPGSYDADLTVRDAGTGCTTVTSFQIIINSNPTITPDATALEVCTGTTSLDLTYSGTTDNPDQYSIDFSAAANTALFADVVNAPLTSSPIVITVPSAPAAAIYGASLTVRNSTTGCVSDVIAITIEVHTTPVVSLGVNPAVCSGVTASSLPYTVTAGAPDRYSINFDATAEGEGFVDIALTNLVAPPLPIVIPAGAATATYNAVLRVEELATGCFSTQAFTVTINPNPTIAAVVDPQVCFGVTTANLTYGATTGNPDRYSIVFGPAANADGFIDVTDAAFAPPAAIVITIPGTAQEITYDADLTISNSATGCASVVVPIQITVNPEVSIAPDPIPEVCSGTTSVDLTFSGLTGGADQYSIDFDVTAEGVGFVDVVTTGPLVSPISITIPALAAAGSYDAVVTISNSATTCFANYPIAVVINPLPTITAVIDPVICLGATTADLNYGATTDSPDLYSIVFSPAAITAGFVDVTDDAFSPPSAIVIAVPGSAAAATYAATLTVSNSTTGCVSAVEPIQIIINPNPAITVVDASLDVCSGTTTVDLVYSATTDSPDQYSLDFDGAAETELFLDVLNAPLTASPIVIVVPSAATAGIYNADFTVRNSLTGCVSAVTAVTVEVHTTPVVSLGANPVVCSGVTTADMTYSATDGAPDSYSITYDAAALTAGFLDVAPTGLSGSPLTIDIPAGAAPATYNAVLRVEELASGCFSTQAFTVTINPLPTITAVVDAQACLGAPTANLTYGATTNSPDRFSIAFGAAALADGFVDVTDVVFAPPAAIVITVPVGATVTAYDADLTVTNSVTGCVSTVVPFQIIIHPNPTITVVDASLEVCSGTTSVALDYSGTTDSPDQYSLDFDAAANTALFVDVVNGSLAASPISITIPAAAAPAIYNASLTVSNSTTGCVSVVTAITVEVHANPTITLGASPAVCLGILSANLTYIATTADEYTLDFDATAEGEGFADVTPFTGLAGGPSQIVIPVPVGAAVGTYNASLTIRDATTLCATSTAVQVTINANPTITAVVDPQICLGATTANLTYGGTTASPDRFSIVFGAAASADGFVDVTDAVFAPPAAIVITIPGTATATTYDADLTVSNSVTGCVSTVEAIQIIIQPAVSITPDPIPAVCSGTATVDFTFTGLTGGADQYSIDFDLTAEGEGFVDVTMTGPLASPITITVPPLAATSTYNAVLTISNSVTLCSANYAITVTIDPTPTITGVVDPQVCFGAAAANLTYGATTGSPDLYSITFSPAAITAGFLDVTDAALAPPADIVVSIPGTAAAATYTASLTVRNSTTGCVSAVEPIQIIINATPTISFVDTNLDVCLGTTTVDLFFSGTTDGPDQYSLDFDAAANTALFVDVVNGTLAGSPITITVPAAPAAGIYNANLTVLNSATGCVSAVTAITIEVHTVPVVSLGASPIACSTVTSASLPYSVTAGAPDSYNIFYSAGAIAAGFVNVGPAALTASPLPIVVPGSAAAATYNAILRVEELASGCFSTQSFTVTVTPPPTITAIVNPQVCFGAATANLTYGATTNSPNRYSIAFGAAALAAGFIDVTDAVFAPPAAIVITIPGAAAAATYDANLTVRNNTTGCVSAIKPIQIIINPAVGITPGANPAVCAGTTTVDLTFGGLIGGADQYAIDFDLNAEGQGFADVTTTGPLASPIAITVPSLAAASAYSAVLTISNSTTTCSATYPITVTVNPNPTIALGPSPAVCSGTVLANLSYTATTADEYTLDFDLAAQGQGFVDVTTFTTMAAAPSQIVVVVPAGAAGNTYHASLTIRNSATLCTTSTPVTVIINDKPTVTLDFNNPAVCSGTTSVDITYSATTSSPSEYSIDFDVAAEAELFVDILNAPLTGSPITIVVPAGATAAIYNANLTVINTTTGCVSSLIPITVAVNENPTITLGTSPDVCQGATTANLAYTATTASPDLYTIDFDAIAEAAGFVDVVSTALPATPVIVPVPVAAAMGVYNATITVSTSGTGCPSAATPFTVTVGIDLTVGTVAPVCISTSALIPITPLVGDPDLYSLDFDAAAEGSGFVDVVDAALPVGNITVTVPAGVAGMFNATLTVRNSSSGCVSAGKPVSIVVGSAIAMGSDPEVCQGVTTADLTYTALTGGPDQYSIDFDLAAEAAGFVDVVDASITTSPIVLVVPATAPVAVYNYNVSVRNSVSGCGSLLTPKTLTVNSLPSANAGVDVTICSAAPYLLAGSSVGSSASTGAWTITSQPSGGDGALSSTAQVADPSTISFTATVAGDYVLTLITDDPAGPCSTAQDDVTITITPIPVLATGQTKAICGNDDVAYEILLNPANLPANTVFNWPDPDGAGPATVGVNIPMGTAGTIHINDRLINFSLVDITVTYQITPSVGLCVGTMENVDIVVRPSPTIELGQAKTICSGDNVAYEILLNPLNTPAGTTLSWPDPDGAGSGTSQLNIAADPAGTPHINDVLYNGTGAPIDVIYSIIATAPNGCRAIPRDVVITVNPGAVADAGAAQSICSSGTATLTGSSIGGLATTGAWSVFLSPAGGDGVLSDLTQIATPSLVTFTATVAGDYTLHLTTDDPTGSCVNVIAAVVITVRAVGDAGCTGGTVGTGDCTTVQITPKPSPATCSNSDGSIIFTIKPFAPAVLTTEVRIDIVGISPSNNTVSRTVHNDSTFNNLPVGVYDYTIEYGDPACIKTGQVTIDRSGTVDVPAFSNLVDPLCFGIASGSATIDVAGETGNPLEWSVDAITWMPFIAGNTVAGLPGGTNIVSVRRDAGDACASGAMLTLAAPPQISTALTPTDATCLDNDGTITVGTVAGGTGPYSFSLNGNAITIPANNIIPGLGNGSYSLVITDALGCSATISTTVSFPGFVNHTVPVITHPDCTGGGLNGIISLQITDTGNFEFGVTTDPSAEPASYSPAGGAQVTVPNLVNGVYAVWLRPAAGTQCPTKIGDLNVSGAFPLSFTTANSNVVCLNTKADITVTNISGAPSLDYTYELTNTGDNSVTTGTILESQSLSAFTISNVSPGNYSFRLLQDQSSLNAACATPISSAASTLLVDGPATILDTISVTRNKSYPDIGTGRARTVISPSGGNMYELRLELVQPQLEFPDQAFVQDWTPVTQNSTTLKYEYTYDHLFAGLYEMRLRDDFGCEHVYDVTIGADQALMIPNIFTPNGDDANEFFYVRNLPAGSSLVVTNRWGKEVFKSGSYDNKWNGGDAADGVYYFQLKTPGEVFNGWVEIFRGL